MIFKLKELNKAKYEILIESSDKLVGYFIREDDGYFYFMLPDPKTGLWSEENILELGTKLQELNKPWHDYMIEHFRYEQNKRNTL